MTIIPQLPGNMYHRNVNLSFLKKWTISVKFSLLILLWLSQKLSFFIIYLSKYCLHLLHFFITEVLLLLFGQILDKLYKLKVSISHMFWLHSKTRCAIWTNIYNTRDAHQFLWCGLKLTRPDEKTLNQILIIEQIFPDNIYRFWPQIFSW